MTGLEITKKVGEIFQSNGWQEKNRDMRTRVFENFCHLLNNLDFLEGKHLLIELAHRYLWISREEYPKALAEAFNKIEDNKLENVKKIYVSSIIRVEDAEKVKSGESLLYDLKIEWFEMSLKNIYTNIDFILVKKITEEIAQDIANGELFCMIDDFLGSGQTVIDSLEMVPDSIRNRINIVAIVGHQFGLDRLNEMQIPYYVYRETKREISDHYPEEVIASKMEIMKAVENVLPEDSYPYSCGFGDCQSLVTVARTPDNTFPIFWHKYVKNNRNFYPPFYRKLS